MRAAQSQALANTFPASPIYFPYVPIRRDLWLSLGWRLPRGSREGGGADQHTVPTPLHPHAWPKGCRVDSKTQGEVTRPRLTGEDLPVGSEQRGAHREVAVGAIGAVFGLLAASQQELQVLALGPARGGSGGRALPAALHASACLPSH